MIYSNTYEQDLLKAQKNIRNIEELNNTKVLITGATGMIGSALVDIIMNKIFMIMIRFKYMQQQGKKNH